MRAGSPGCWCWRSHSPLPSGSRSIDRVHRVHRGRARPPRLSLLRRESGDPARSDCGAINLDALQAGGRTRDVVMFGAGNSELEESVRSSALLQGREIRPEPHPEQGLYYSSDEINFARHGCRPCTSRRASTMRRGDRNMAMAQWDDYMAQRYRQAGDKYSEDWEHGRRDRGFGFISEVGDRLGVHAAVSAMVSGQRVQRGSRPRRARD